MALPYGSYSLRPCTDGVGNTLEVAGKPPKPSGSSNASGPPKAIFLRLSDATLNHLRSLSAAGASDALSKLALEFSPGSSAPSALNIGESSYAITKRNDQPAGAAEVFASSASALAKGKGRAVESVPAAGPDTELQSLGSACRESYAVAHSAPRKVIVEKTAANMAERMRERNAQLEREKEGRRVVVVDDESFLAGGGGKKSRGRKMPSKGPGANSPLLRATAISAKRSPSPAGLPSRPSPSIGSTGTGTGAGVRQPSRLIASEAVKGLKSRKEKETPVQLQAPGQNQGVTSHAMTSGSSSSTSGSSQFKAQPEPSASRTAAPVPGAAETAAGHTGTARIASSGSSISSHSSSHVSASSNAPSYTSTATTLSTHTTAPSAAGSSKDSAHSPPRIELPDTHSVPLVAPPAPKYHMTRLDEDDLASASSSSEDEDAKMPLARRMTSPVKTSASISASTRPSSKTAKSPPNPPVRQQQRSVPAGPRVGLRKSASPDTTTAAAETTARDIKAQTFSARSRSVSSDRASSSASSSSSADTALAKAPKAPSSAKRKASISTEPAQTGNVASAPSPASAKLLVPEDASNKKVRTSPPALTAGVGRTAPKTAAKTAGGTRLSRPLPKKPSPSSSARNSPQPPVRAVSATEDSTAVATQFGKGAISAGLASTATSSTSTSRSVSPAPEVVSTASGSMASMSVASLAPVSTATPSSRLATPLPSPGLHPLPAKPAGSPAPGSRSPALAAGNTSAASAPPSPIISRPPTSVGSVYAPGAPKVAKPLPASLPAKPSTVVPPTFSRSGSSSSLSRSGQPASLAPGNNNNNNNNSIVNGAAPSGTHSPIVSTFPKRHQDGRGGSAASSAANTPVLKGGDAFSPHLSGSRQPGGGKGDSAHEPFAGKKRKSSRGPGEDSKKRRKGSSKPTVEFTSSEEDEQDDEEEGAVVEEGEEEEGEVDADGESFDDDFSDHHPSTRGRATDRKATTTSGARSSEHKGDARSEKMVKKPSYLTSDLPSFSRKGRTAELLASESRGRSSRNGSVSRAATPTLHRERDESPGSGRSSDRKRGFVEITSDAEFARYTRRFSEDLFPAYSKLYAKLEEVQKKLLRNSGGRNGSPAPVGSAMSVSVADLSRQVEEVNDRGAELETIRRALQRYNDGKMRRIEGVRS